MGTAASRQSACTGCAEGAAHGHGGQKILDRGPPSPRRRCDAAAARRFPPRCAATLPPPRRTPRCQDREGVDLLPQPVQRDGAVQPVELPAREQPVRDGARGGRALLPVHEDDRARAHAAQPVGEGRAVAQLHACAGADHGAPAVLADVPVAQVQAAPDQDRAVPHPHAAPRTRAAARARARAQEGGAARGEARGQGAQGGRH